MCNCFMCRNKDNLDRLYGYTVGRIQQLETIKRDLEHNNIKPSSIADDTLEGTLARVECDLEESYTILACLQKELGITEDPLLC